MVSVFEKIKELDGMALLSKNDRLVNGIMNSIDEGILVQGSKLPSVKNMATGLNFAAQTVVRAYKDLKDKGLVESKTRLGYFVVNEDTVQVSKVALLMYAFHPFQEAFYNTFRKNLGENIQVDVYFHHSNIDVFETILGNIKGQYGMYVIAPIPHEKTKKLLKGFPRKKILMVDRFEEIHSYYAHVTQEFEDATYAALTELKDRIKKYSEFVLFYKQDADYPIEVLRAFDKFIRDNDINGTVLDRYVKRSLKKDTVYFTIGDGDLWELLNDVTKKKYKLGKDIGVFSNTAGPVKRFVCGGITTFAADYKLMAKKAAEFVLNREPISETIPTKLKMRGSV